jgi:predicted RNA-binding protein YlxR (DUF448 family)
MRLCPKCRTFSDDELLRFCINDGTPLVSINQTNKLWSEGTEYVRDVKNKIQRKIRRSQIKKVISMLVTTVVVTSVISVITLKSWIHTHPEEVAEIRGEKTKENETVAVVTTEKEEVQIGIESTPLAAVPEVEKARTPDNMEVKIAKKVTESPKTIEITEDVDISKDKKVNTNKNNNTNKNDNTNKSTVSSPPLESCSATDQQRFADEIKRSYTSFWKNKILSQENRLFEKYLKDQKLRQGAQLSVFQNGITVRVDKKCETATATVPIEWTVYSTAQAFLSERKTVSGSEVFTCKKGKIWSCL